MFQNQSKGRILVVKHGALGDIVQGFDAFATLRAGNPHAHISLMTGTSFVPLAKMMPWFDDVIPDPRRGILNFFAMLDVRRHLRQNWSFIVDMQCSRRTKHYFSYFSRRETRWISNAFGCSDPLPDFAGVNNRERMIVSAEMAGGVRQTASMKWLDEHIIMSKNDFLNDPQMSYAVLVPGCSPANPQKRWPAEHFAAVGNDLLARGIKVIVVGTEDDRDAVDTVLAAATDFIDLCGKTNLSGLARLMRGASYVIGNDTGPMFLAARSGAPTLMVMGPDTDPAMSAPTGEACNWLIGRPISSISVAMALTALYDL